MEQIRPTPWAAARPKAERMEREEREIEAATWSKRKQGWGGGRVGGCGGQVTSRRARRAAGEATTGVTEEVTVAGRAEQRRRGRAVLGVLCWVLLWRRRGPLTRSSNWAGVATSRRTKSASPSSSGSVVLSRNCGAFPSVGSPVERARMRTPASEKARSAAVSGVAPARAGGTGSRCSC
eukprot:scaffold10943_cov102-Isochrysis_galbana.AAC.4